MTMRISQEHLQANQFVVGLIAVYIVIRGRVTACRLSLCPNGCRICEFFFRRSANGTENRDAGEY